MPQKLCVITGVGPGVGSSLVEAFSEAGYTVAMLARSEDRLAALSAQFTNAQSYVCDVSVEAEVVKVSEQILTQHGVPDVVIHNAIAGRMGSFQDIPAQEFNKNFQVNTMGLIYLSQALVPKMLDAGRGMLMVTGSKYAHEANGSMVTFAVAKSSQRLFLESVSPELAADGVAACYAIVDGVVDSESMRGYFPDKKDEFFLQPSVIAQVCLDEVRDSKGSELWISTAGVRRIS